MTDQGAEPIQIAFDTSVYRLDAIKKAALKFAGTFHILISSATEGVATVSLSPKSGTVDPMGAVGEFQNEVLDQELREVVVRETEGIRNLLLAQAFSATSLVDAAGDEADYRLDPLGIGSPDAARGSNSR